MSSSGDVAHLHLHASELREKVFAFVQKGMSNIDNRSKRDVMPREGDCNGRTARAVAALAAKGGFSRNQKRMCQIPIIQKMYCTTYVEKDHIWKFWNIVCHFPSLTQLSATVRRWLPDGFPCTARLVVNIAWDTPIRELARYGRVARGLNLCAEYLVLISSVAELGRVVLGK
jgi:hypothetical protein